MTVVELFAGAGGAASGLRSAGLRCVLAVERDPYRCEVLRRMGLPVHEGDVRELGAPPAADVWWASPPCQPFSSAGQRKGAADERNGWPWVWDLYDRTPVADRPRWLLAENVAGLTHHAARATCRADPVAGNWREPDPTGCAGCYLAEVIVPELRERFPAVSWRVLDAADFGVPQHRRRLILVAGPEPYRWPRATHADPDRPLIGLPRWRTVRDAIGALSTVGPGGCAIAHGPDEPSQALGTRGNAMADPGPHQGALAQSARTLRPDQPATTLDTGLNAYVLDVTDGPAPTIAGPAGNQGPWLETGQNSGPPGDRYPHRAGVDGPAPTIRTRNRGAPLALVDAPSPCLSTREGNAASNFGAQGAKTRPRRAGDQLRRLLTPEECAALQAFPADHPWGEATKAARYAAIGDAVPPPFAKALGRALAGSS